VAAREVAGWDLRPLRHWRAVSGAKYAARGGALRAADVPVVVELLDEITGRDRRRLSTTQCAATLVERSRPKSSPTHHLFEWDNDKAADAHRLEQARDIIRSVTVVFEDAPEHVVRAYPVVNTGGVRGPRPMARLLSEPEVMAELVAQARTDAVAWAKRWARLRDVAELRSVFAEIAKIEASPAAVRPKKRKSA
jgi:hypothetical protein